MFYICTAIHAIRLNANGKIWIEIVFSNVKQINTNTRIALIFYLSGGVIPSAEMGSGYTPPEGCLHTRKCKQIINGLTRWNVQVSLITCPLGPARKKYVWKSLFTTIFLSRHFISHLMNELCGAFDRSFGWIEYSFFWGLFRVNTEQSFPSTA